MAQETFSSEIVYSTTVNSHPQYLYRKISPQGSGADIILSDTASSSPVQFQISPQVWNPAKSSLNWTVLCDASATANTRTWINANLLSMISRITVYSSSTSNILLDLTNVEKYASMISPGSTVLSKLATKASTSRLVTTATVAAAKPFITEDLTRAMDTSVGAAYFSATNLSGAGTACMTPSTGRLNFFTAAAVTAMAFNVSISLESFYNTILALNKDIYHTENLIVDVYFNGKNNFGCQNVNDATNPTVGSTVIVNNVTVGSFNMVLATESNLRLQAQVIDAVMSQGVSLPFCYPTCIRQSDQATTSQSYSISLTSAYGKRLLGILIAPFDANGADANAKAPLNNVHRRDTITTFNTFMNSIPVKYPAGVDASQGLDWQLFGQDFFMGSAVQSIAEYIHNEWVYGDMFCRPQPLWALDQTVIDGYDLTQQQATYQLQATLSAARTLSWVTVLLGQKVVSFTAQGTYVN